MASESKKDKVKILLFGNPGVGKSTTINAYVESRYPGKKFKICQSGVSVVGGKTKNNQEIHFPDEVIIDTPGLADETLREKAAKEIESALKKGGSYKIVFLCTLQAGRVKPDDVNTVVTVLKCLKTDATINFSLIVTLMSKKVLRRIVKDAEEFATFFELLQGFKPKLIAFIMRNEEAADEENYVIPVEDQEVKIYGSSDWEKENSTVAQCFDKLPIIKIAPKEVEPIDVRSYDEKVKEIEEKMRQKEKEMEAKIKSMDTQMKGLKTSLANANDEAQRARSDMDDLVKGTLKDTNKQLKESNKQLEDLRKENERLRNKGCICGTGIVTLKSKKKKKVKDVVIGDEILVGKDIFSLVFLTYQDPDMDMIEIHLRFNHTMTSVILTSTHLLYTDSKQFITAEAVGIGDQIMLSNGVLAECTSIVLLPKREAFSVFTFAGKVDVNSVSVSSFTSNTIKLQSFLPLASILSYVLPFRWLKPIAYDGFYKGLKFINHYQSTKI